MTLVGQIGFMASLLVFRSYFEWTSDPPFWAILIVVVAMVTSLVAHMSMIALIPIAKEMDKIDEAWRELKKQKAERNKFMDFLKAKAFKSTIVSRKEINEHMGWRDETTES